MQTRYFFETVFFFLLLLVFQYYLIIFNQEYNILKGFFKEGDTLKDNFDNGELT